MAVRGGVANQKEAQTDGDEETQTGEGKATNLEGWEKGGKAGIKIRKVLDIEEC